MKIPVFILTVALGALLALEGWTLSAVVDLKTDVAGLSGRVDLITKQIYEKPENAPSPAVVARSPRDHGL